MRCSRTCLAVVLALFSTAALVSPAAADPLPGQVPKFEQLPMIATTILDSTGVPQVYNGHDELSTLYQGVIPGTGFRGIAMADDFADEFNTPVVHVKWWGSYLDNFRNPDQTLNKFLIAFESDSPADPLDPTSFSTPKDVLSFEVVDLVPAGPLAPDSGTYTEKLVFASPVESIYEYNAELKMDFFQDPDTVYWIKIAALVEGQNAGGMTSSDTRWGWHNRDYTVTNPLASPFVFPGEVDEQPTIDPLYPSEVWHFQDDAVSATTFFGPDLLNGTLIVTQDNYVPESYVDGLDGPGPVPVPPGGHGGIGQFSKDLAFVLYTVPEPSSVILLMIGLIALTGHRRHHPPSP